MRTGVMLCVLCCLLTGCIVQSIHPFYTKETKIRLNEINGNWIPVIQCGSAVEKEDSSPWVFYRGKIICYDKDNRESQLRLVCFEVGGNTFADIMPDKGIKENAFWSAGMISVHTLFKVNLSDDRLELIPMDVEWIEKVIEEKKLNLDYITESKDRNTIFTASSEQWTEFLKVYGDNSELFNKQNHYVFKRR